MYLEYFCGSRVLALARNLLEFTWGTMMVKKSTFTGWSAMALLLGLSASVSAATYYVATGDANASDSNAGTLAAPWKTISKANQTLVADDTVYIKAGTYSSFVAPARSGNSAAYITYRNY